MQNFNPLEQLIFSASIYARTKYQKEICDFNPTQKQIEFLEELKNSDIIKNSLIMFIALETEQRYKLVQSLVGDIRNRKISDEQMEQILDSIKNTGEKLI